MTDVGNGSSGGSPDGRLNRRLQILAVALAMAGAAVPLHLVVLESGGPVAPFDISFWGIALGFATTELFVIHLHVRSTAHTVSMSEIPLMLGLALTSPGALIAGRLVGAGVARALRRRQPAYKLAFNLALFYFETVIALAAYRLVLDGRSPISVAGLGAGLMALVIAMIVSAACVTIAITLDQPGRGLKSVARAMGSGMVISFLSALLGVAGLAVAWREPLALGGIVVVAAGMYGALRVYGSLNQRFEDLESVYAFTSAIDAAVDTDELIEAMLGQTVRLFDARFAEVVMARGIGSTAVGVAADGSSSRRPAPPGIVEAMTTHTEGSAVFPLGDLSPAIVDHYVGRGVTDAMVALLAGGDGTATMIVVGGRKRPGRFTPDEMRLFDTLARQARLSFERGRLVDRLRREAGQKEHQALHDALTNLPNRLHFSIVIEDALRKALENGGRLVVLLVDLDRFKEINDTLGHQRGDVLLQEMALRLSDAVGGDEHVARLGGDEFGILLRDVSGIAEAADWARRIGQALHRPFLNEGLAIQVSGSIGIAMAPEHGTDGTTLLRRADVAMYQAKSAGSSFEVYDPRQDRYSTRRLVMAAELRDALDKGSISVSYQPLANLADGSPVGVEALARWTHPRHGPVPPDEFIELAERTGLIRPLTEHVLRTAFRDVMRLRADGHRLSVAVNIAASSLTDEDFPDFVARLIGEYDVDPQAVTLEVTETTMMTDSARARLVLNALDELGVALAIDDFGTGYSSLRYLSSLPVDEVKIDRSFVMDMAVDERLAKIVTSTTALVHSLGLKVVAEGVENRGTWELLKEAGCDIAQGYYLARPMPFTDLSAWLTSGAEPVGDGGPRLTTGGVAAD
jgi:diguanylate cyclase (GGDEF)-like protein